MQVEIERKFLAANDGWRAYIRRSTDIVQGYLAITKLATIRLRLSGGEATFNIKSGSDILRRFEYEIPIPVSEADDLFNLCLFTPIRKTRHEFLAADGHLWEIDEFGGACRGLVMAEIELADAAEDFERPAWLGEEVTHNPRFRNESLAVEGRFSPTGA